MNKDESKCFNYKICSEPRFKNGPMCKKHGCAKCGGIVLADSEDGPELLCPEHYEQFYGDDVHE